MAYIGKTPVIGNFVKLDSITAVNGQAAYTMQNGGVNFTSYDNVNQFLVSLNGILQSPTDSFTVSGSTLTFASNLSTGDVIDFVLVLGNSLDIGTPSDNTVSLAKLTATGTKDATTFLRGDNTFASAGLSGWSEDGANNNLLPANASAGIYLGVNSATAANLLDDYEEGTWTPDPQSGGTSIGIYTPTASYTKIGRYVNVQFTIRRNDSASLTDALQIEGLPFTSSSTAMDANINGGVWVDNSSGDHIGLLNIGGNSTKIGNMRKTNTMDASIAADEWSNGRYLYGSANYVAS